MNKRALLELYLEQYEIAGRSSPERSNELKKFIAFVESRDTDLIDYGVLLDWLNVRHETCSVSTLTSIQNRISVFVDWASHFDPDIGKVPKRKHAPKSRRNPFMLSQRQLSRFVKVQRGIEKKNINSFTFPMLTCLLYVTGMRVGEALNLKRDEIDFSSRKIYIPAGNGDIDRVISFSTSTLDSLRKYYSWRKHSSKQEPYFFVHQRNGSTRYQDYRLSVNETVAQLGYRKPNSTGYNRRNLRIHDLRHCYAVNSLIRAYEDYPDLHEAAAKLSASLGHIRPEHTYWYISSVPRLIEISFNRCM